MSDRKSRFNLFKFNKKKNNLNWSDDDKNSDDLSFPSFDSIIPENSPLKNKSNGESGFFNDELNSRDDSRFNGELILRNDSNSKDDSRFDDDLDGVDEKYAKYIFSQKSEISDNFENPKEYSQYKKPDSFDDLFDDDFLDFDAGEKGEIDSKNNLKLKDKLLKFKDDLSNKNKHSKNLFGKIIFALIILVLVSSIFYFFVYHPFQNELNLEKNSKLNEINTLYKGPLEINDNAYALKNQVNRAYNVDEIKSVDVLMFATKDWRMHHSAKIVDCKDDFGRVMMSYGENKNIIMSVKDANDFVKDNDAKVLSNVEFEKVNTVIVPVSLSRLQATVGLISVGSVVDIYSLRDNSTDYDYMDEEEPMSTNGTVNGSLENEGKMDDASFDDDLEITEDESSESADEDPLVSGATVLAILRSKDSGLVDSAISKSNTLIKGNEARPFENTSSYSTDVEEQLKKAVLNSNNSDSALDSYLISYGVRLSNYERMSNLGDLDSEYIILLEVPQSDVNFVINNMDNVILTIPTDFAPNWVVSELNQTYYENLYQNQSLDFF